MKASWIQSAVFASVALSLVGTGCATKKQVRAIVAPVENRVGDVEKKQTEHTAAIGELETGVSRADERAMDADKKAVAAGEAANRANEAANQAGQRAEMARNMSEKNTARIGDVERNVQNLDNYKMVSENSVLFKLNSAKLTDEAKQQLDQIAQAVSGKDRFVVEVQGFTDTSGSLNRNLELSRQRADAVVRYLTLNHKVPLRRFQLLGVGEEAPSADNKTREGRKQNRRVEVRVFGLPEMNAGNRANPATTSGSTQ